jgi:uncharacterized protein (TIGR03086 family)
VVRGVADNQLEHPTPCVEYDVRNLLNHLFHVVVNFQALAAKQNADFTTTPDYLSGDWRDRFAMETTRLVEAWAVPGADEGITGMMNLPARTVGRMALLDLTVHSWDLARATGRDYVPNPASVRELGEFIVEMGPMARQMKVFGEPCPVPAGADEFALLLGATGRDPRWTKAA